MRVAYFNTLQNTFADQSIEGCVTLAPRHARSTVTRRRQPEATPAVVIKTSSKSWFLVMATSVAGAVMVGLGGGLIAACLTLQTPATPAVMSQPENVTQPVVAVQHAEPDTSVLSNTVAILDRQLNDLSAEMEQLKKQQMEMQETARLAKSDLEDAI